MTYGFFIEGGNPVYQRLLVPGREWSARQHVVVTFMFPHDFHRSTSHVCVEGVTALTSALGYGLHVLAIMVLGVLTRPRMAKLIVAFLSFSSSL